MWVVKMKKKKTIFYLLLGFSSVYLLVAYFLNNFRFGSMMYHHFYSETSNVLFYTNSIIIWIWVSSLFIIILLSFGSGVKEPLDFKEILNNDAAV